LRKNPICHLKVDTEVVAEVERAEPSFKRTAAQLQVLLAVAMQLGRLGVNVIEVSSMYPRPRLE
jgi:hypothetical protein